MPDDGVPYKFNDDAQARFLDRYAATGRKVHSCQYAGVTAKTVDDHRKKHSEFDELYEESYATYTESVSQEVHRRGVTGWEEPVWKAGVRAMEVVLDNDGRPVRVQDVDHEGKLLFEEDGVTPAMVTTLRHATIRKFSDRLLELEAKRHEPGYRDKQTVDLKVSGGVLAVPMGTQAEWEEKYDSEPKPDDDNRTTQRS